MASPCCFCCCCLSDLWVLELDEGKALAHAVRALGHENAACGCRTRCSMRSRACQACRLHSFLLRNMFQSHPYAGGGLWAPAADAPPPCCTQITAAAANCTHPPGRARSGCRSCSARQQASHAWPQAPQADRPPLCNPGSNATAVAAAVRTEQLPKPLWAHPGQQLPRLLHY